MKERLGQQPDEFYFDEGTRMFIRRGEKPPETAEPANRQKKPEERNPLPEQINSMRVEELASLPYWLVPPSRKEEVELFKARQKRKALLETGHNDGVVSGGKTRTPQADPTPQMRTGPRGGRYTEAKTREGRPYRRYF